VSRSEALAADAVSTLKKIESMKAAAAIPGSKEIDRGVARAVKSLRNVRLSFNKYISDS
jgi:hypothetical protein